VYSLGPEVLYEESNANGLQLIRATAKHFSDLQVAVGMPFPVLVPRLHKGIVPFDLHKGQTSKNLANA
jgi:hypothetical protein